VLQDVLPQLFGHAGNFEMIVFGVLVILVLQRARGGLWPVLSRLVPAANPVRCPSTRPMRCRAGRCPPMGSR
jgi:branched-chain amino acid transport system permease protein